MIYRRCLRFEMKVYSAAAIAVVLESKKVCFAAAKVARVLAVSFRQISLDSWEGEPVCLAVDIGDVVVGAVVGICVALREAVSGYHDVRFCVYCAAVIEDL